METAEAQNPTMGQIMAMEMEQEASITRNLIEKLPEDKFEWQPHEKSMTLGRLANHVVEAFEWTESIIGQDVLDFSEMDYEPATFDTTEAVLERLDKSASAAAKVLKTTTDAEIVKPWTMKDGEKVFLTMPKAACIRGFVLNHMIHHRGQLSVFMRLLDIPLPQIYGPSADEPDM